MADLRNALRKGWRVRPHRFARQEPPLVVRPLEQRRVLSVSPAVAMALSGAAETDLAQGVATNPDPATPLGTDAAHQTPIDPGNGAAEAEATVVASQPEETTPPAAETLAESDNPSAAAPDSVEPGVESNVESAVDSEQIGVVLDVADDPPPPTVDEGRELMIEDIGVFTDTTVPEGEPLYTFTIDWGDGKSDEGVATIDFPGAEEQPLRGSFDGAHIYADNGVYTVTVTLTSPGGETASGALTVIVDNVDPTLEGETDVFFVNEGAPFSETFGFHDPGFDNPDNPEGEVVEEFTFTIDWGDGSELDTGEAAIDVPGGEHVLTEGSLAGSHTYADNGVYTMTVFVSDDDGGMDSRALTVIVNNVAPTLELGEIDGLMVNEGQTFTITGETFQFRDPGFDNPDNPEGEVVEEFTFAIDWGDGSELDNGQAMIDVAGAEGVFTRGSFQGTHTFADDGSYTVTVFVSDDDGGMDMQSFTVIVNNVAPVLGELGPRMVDEGELLSIVDMFQFTDPGFDNPSHPDGPTTESFTYMIDWGDDTEFVPEPQGVINVTTGSPGVDSAGSFGGSHVYADNGTYTVTVTVFDDDGGTDMQSFIVTVSNVAPALDQIEGFSVDEGEAFSIADIGRFTDPGFDNPTNVGGPTRETFTYTIDWGDDTEFVPDLQPVENVTTGSPGVDSAGSFGGSHVYADNGTYTVTVTVFDDDGGTDMQSFIVTVSNVAPALDQIEGFSVDEGEAFSIADIGRFTDPGFDNPTNVGGPTRETFTYTIDWGDDTEFVPDPQDVTSVAPGAPGVKTAGSFDGSHLYADNGTYVVTVRVVDDDGGVGTMMFTITVDNVAPTLNVVGDQTASLAEGLSIQDLGVFTDPGFDNPTNVGGPTRETFVAMIDWGDGTPVEFAPAAIDAVGGPGAPTGGSVEGLHFFRPAGEFTVTVTLFDDDGGFDVGQFNVVAFVIKGNPPSIFVPGGAGGTFPGPAAPAQGPASPTSGPEMTRLELRRPGSTGVAGAEPQLVLRVVSEPGSERLPDDVLDNLPKLFKRLPDGHYQIYRIEADGTERLVVDVIVREGRNIDVTDDVDAGGGVSPQVPPQPVPAAEPTEAPEAGDEVRQEETPDEARGEETPEAQGELSAAAIALGGGYAAYAAPLARRRLGRRERRPTAPTKARRLARRLRCPEC